MEPGRLPRKERPGFARLVMAQHLQRNARTREASLEVRFFGLPRVLVRGASLKIVSSRGALEMLARIARPDAEAHERDAVALDVWPELPTSEARAALRRHLHYLDQALARAGQRRLVVRPPTEAQVRQFAQFLATVNLSRGGTWTEDFGLGAGERPPSDDWAPAEGCPYR